MVESLKTCCIQFISINNNIDDVKSKLKVLPHSLLLQMAPYLSPFGLHVIQDWTTIEASKLNGFWCRVDQYPVSYLLKLRRRRMLKVDKGRSEEDNDVTEEEFFCNALLHSLMDRLQSQDSVDNCHSKAWQLYQLYPQQAKINMYSTDQNALCCNLERFMLILSKGVTELTITARCAAIMDANFNIFAPVLSRVTKLYLSIYSGSVSDYNGLYRVLSYLRSHALRSVRFFCRTESIAVDNFRRLWEAIYRDLPHESAATEEQTSFPNVDEGSDYFEDQIYDGPEAKRQKTGPIADEDLYDCAFEPFFETVSIASKILRLEIFLSETNRYNGIYIPALRGWQNLQSLTLNGMKIEKEDFRTICENLQSSLQELVLRDFDCAKHEKALLRLACPRSCSLHETAHTSKKYMLEKLALLSCTRIDGFYHRLLANPEKCDKQAMESLANTDKNSSACVFYGLKILEIVTDKINFDDLSSGLRYNISLEHLRLEYERMSDEDLYGLWSSVSDVWRTLDPPLNISNPTFLPGIDLFTFHFADHSTLQSFDVASCGIKSCGERENNTPIELHILLKSNTLKQLSVVSCFNNPETIVSLMSCKHLLTFSPLETLIWKNNAMDENSLRRFSQILRDRQNLPHLRNLDISCNVFYGEVIYDFIEGIRHGGRYFEKLAVYGLGNGNADMNADRNKQEIELAKYCRNFVSKSYGYGIRKFDAVDYVSVM